MQITRNQAREMTRNPCIIEEKTERSLPIVTITKKLEVAANLIVMMPAR